MIHIGIVDPHEIMRLGLVQLVESAGGIRVVGAAGSFPDLLAQNKLPRIDVLVLEPHFAGHFDPLILQSIKKCREIRAVLVFSNSTDSDHVQSALRAGATGYVSKAAQLAELLEGITRVARGENYLCQEVAAKVALRVISPSSKHPHELLTDREFEILLLLVKGRTVAGAADELHISAKTISTHKSRLMRKMKVDSFSKLVQYASAHRLIAD